MLVFLQMFFGLLAVGGGAVGLYISYVEGNPNDGLEWRFATMGGGLFVLGAFLVASSILTLTSNTRQPRRSINIEGQFIIVLAIAASVVVAAGISAYSLMEGFRFGVVIGLIFSYVFVEVLRRHMRALFERRPLLSKEDIAVLKTTRKLRKAGRLVIVRNGNENDLHIDGKSITTTPQAASTQEVRTVRQTSTATTK
jgi:hypothetical protein